MNSKKKGIGVCPLLQIVLNAIFFVGIQTIFAPCAPHEDGTWMTCHWAGEALTGLAAVMLILSLLHLVPLRSGTKTGLAIAMIPLAVLVICLPGHLIPLCMMETMHCHTVMQPAVTALSLLNLMLALADIYVYRRGENG